jgi:hypothetical protein
VRRLIGEDALEAEVGALKLRVSRDDVLEVLPEPSEGPRLPEGVSFRPGPEARLEAREINIIGQRAEEAVEHVDKFLTTPCWRASIKCASCTASGWACCDALSASCSQRTPTWRSSMPRPPAKAARERQLSN